MGRNQTGSTGRTSSVSPLRFVCQHLIDENFIFPLFPLEEIIFSHSLQRELWQFPDKWRRTFKPEKSELNSF